MIEVKIEMLGSPSPGLFNALVGIDGIVTVVRNVKVPKSLTKKQREYFLIAEAFSIESRKVKTNG